MFYFARCINIILTRCWHSSLNMMFIQLKNKIHTRHYLSPIIIFIHRNSSNKVLSRATWAFGAVPILF